MSLEHAFLIPGVARPNPTRAAPQRAATGTEETPGFSASTWLTSSLLGASFVRGRQRRVARRHAIGAQELMEPPLRINDCLVESCKACLEALSGDSASSRGKERGPIWSVEEEEEEDAITYARFRIDQLQENQAQVVGNTLRRTLLRQDLFRTTAAVAFRLQRRTFSEFDGDEKVQVSPPEPTLHEFSSVPGVLEKMIDVVRNVQQISVLETPWEAPKDLPLTGYAKATDEPDTWRWVSRRCGPCSVQVGDLDMVDSSTFFERPARLPEPQHHILRVTAPAMLDLEVEATCCSQTEWEESPFFEKYRKQLRFDGWLLVPPLFSPVKKVNYRVTRGEDGGEVVQLELWTTKAARPADLLRTSAATLLAGLASSAMQQGEVSLADELLQQFGIKEAPKWGEEMDKVAPEVPERQWKPEVKEEEEDVLVDGADDMLLEDGTPWPGLDLTEELLGDMYQDPFANTDMANPFLSPDMDSPLLTPDVDKEFDPDYPYV